MKRLFRDRFPAILILVTFMLAMILCVFSVDFVKQLYDLDSSMSNPDTYAQMYYVGISDFAGDSEAFCEKIQAVLEEVRDYRSTIGVMYDKNNFFIFSGGAIPGRLKEGDILTGDRLRDNHGSFAYVNRAVAATENGRKGIYIDDCEIEYRIQGILYDRAFSEASRVILYRDLHREDVMEACVHDIYRTYSFFSIPGENNTALLFFIGGSGSQKIDEEKERFERLLSAAGFATNSFVAETYRESEDKETLGIRTWMYIIVCFMAYGTMYYAIVLWITRRRKNLAIAVAMGLPGRFLYGMILKGIIPLIMLGGVLSGAVMVLVGYVYAVRLQSIFELIVVSLLIGVCVSVAFTCYSVRRVINSNLIEMIVGNE